MTREPLERALQSDETGTAESVVVGHRETQATDPTVIHSCLFVPHLGRG